VLADKISTQPTSVSKTSPVDCFVATVPEPKSKLPYASQIEAFRNDIRVLSDSLSPNGVAWLWCKDFIWKPIPNWDLPGIGVSYRDIAKDYVARLLGAEPPTNPQDEPNREDFWFKDASQGKYISVHVKWVPNGKDACLEVDLGKLASDVYVLVQGEEMNILGWAGINYLKCVGPTNRGDGSGAKYYLHHTRLLPFDAIEAHSQYLRWGEWAHFPSRIVNLLRCAGFFIQEFRKEDDRHILLASKSRRTTPDRTPRTYQDCIELVCDPFDSPVVRTHWGFLREKRN